MANYPLFVKRDFDGFFGLFVDNLVQLLLIPVLCGALCGMTGDDVKYVYTYIIPGAAVSILVGNVFYAWQAHRLAQRTGKSDVCALPYGINTPSLLVYIAFVMAPAYQSTKDPRVAWQMGLLACLGSGLIEFFGSFVANAIRKKTPRAALLSTLAGISIGFIAMTFALQIFHRPFVGMLPLAVILVALFARWPFPMGLPGGMVALLLGAGCGWLLPKSLSGVELTLTGVQAAWEGRGLFLPSFCGVEIINIFNLPASEWLGYLSVIIPMGLFNVIGSLQNIESAAASGDDFETAPSLAANGIGTICAALFGSCFPTTIYIGHPGWKALGARAGYSTLNGVVITLICVTGTLPLVAALIPVEAGMAIVFWVGIVITAQAFQASEGRHAPAVAIGLFPAIAAWGATVMEGAFRIAGGSTISQTLLANTDAQANGFLVHGMIAVERGSIFTCMILGAISVFLIDRKFFAAAGWSLIAAALTAMGLMHAFQVDGNSINYLFNFDLLTGASTIPDGVYAYRALNIAGGYLLTSAAFFACGWYNRSHPQPEVGGH